MLIEDENFNQIQMTPEMLQLYLTTEDGPTLNVDLVIIDLPNCEDFVNVFHQLGVKHVISFVALDHFSLQEDQSF